ncbi:spherulation-specific family 4 protein [Nannocystis sp.]|uniref:spherulation-specific family 4 protein n=1 Tax=Nannocystis sp. TaxID=1962667 RepID=UPI0025E0C733|nr:spherulation-specific family 4 protein [Nannocystis sp.]MBK7828579.1 hypothetical protein [Nannocystis sp.]
MLRNTTALALLCPLLALGCDADPGPDTASTDGPELAPADESSGADEEPSSSLGGDDSLGSDECVDESCEQYACGAVCSSTSVSFLACSAANQWAQDQDDLAQTFTTCGAFTLTAVKLPMFRCSANGDVQLKLSLRTVTNNQPGATVLAQSDVIPPGGVHDDCQGPTYDFQDVTFSFASKPQLAAGTYALVLETSPVPPATSSYGSVFWQRSHDFAPNPYAGGTYWHRYQWGNNPPQAWTGNNNYDLSFSLQSLCGDDVLDSGEQCDNGGSNGNNAACKLNCTTNVCGDGFKGPGEQCDLGGSNANTAGCKSDCTMNVCGDGFKGPNEVCDDGNTVGGDLCSSSCSEKMRLAIPSYINPDLDSDPSQWSTLLANTAPGDIVMINPADGQDGEFGQEWLDATVQARDQGKIVLAYVSTRWGARYFDRNDCLARNEGPSENCQMDSGTYTFLLDGEVETETTQYIQADIDNYYSWYSPSGIFLDEGPTVWEDTIDGVTQAKCQDVEAHYAWLANYVREHDGGATVAINPGTKTCESYLDYFDIIANFEGSASTYLNSWADYTQSWPANYPASRFWHIVHSAPAAQLDSIITKAGQRNAGWVDVTDHDYGALPSYLAAEAAKLH